MSWSRVELSSDLIPFLTADEWKLSIFALGVLITLSVFIIYPRVLESRSNWPTWLLLASVLGLWILAFRDALISGFPISKTSFWIPFVIVLLVLKPPNASDLMKGVKVVVALVWLLLFGDLLILTANEIGKTQTPASIWLFMQSLMDGTWQPGFLPVGMNLAVLGILALCLAFSRGYEVPFTSTAVLGLLLVILSGSRSSYLAAIVAIIIVQSTWIVRRHTGVSKQQTLSVVPAILVLFLVFVVSSLTLVNTRTNDQNQLGRSPESSVAFAEQVPPKDLLATPKANQVVPQIGYPEYSDTASSALSGRNEIWQFHWNQIMQNPTSILGEDSAQILNSLGLDHDRPGESSSPMQSAHNMILDHWHRFGLLGLALLASTILNSSLIVVSAATKNRNPLGVGFVAAILILGISDVIFSWTELTSGVMLLLWVVYLVRSPLESSKRKSFNFVRSARGIA